jgi:hypothetical protein
MTFSKLCRGEYALTMEVIKKQLPSQNTVSLALDDEKSTNKLIITSVVSYYMVGNWALGDVILSVDEVDRLFFPAFKRYLNMMCQGRIHCSKASG